MSAPPVSCQLSHLNQQLNRWGVNITFNIIEAAGTCLLIDQRGKKTFICKPLTLPDNP